MARARPENILASVTSLFSIFLIREGASEVEAELKAGGKERVDIRVRSNITLRTYGLYFGDGFLQWKFYVLESYGEIVII